MDPLTPSEVTELRRLLSRLIESAGPPPRGLLPLLQEAVERVEPYRPPVASADTTPPSASGSGGSATRPMLKG
jgi:hypothetical protein